MNQRESRKRNKNIIELNENKNTTYTTREDIQIANKHVRDAPHLMSSGKSKLKQMQVTHLLQWSKPKTLNTPQAGEDVEPQELSFTAGGKAKWCSRFGRQFGGFLED